IHFEVDRCSEPAQLEALRAGITRILGDVRAAVEDWPKMLDIARASIADLQRLPGGNEGDTAEACALLQWMVDDHFCFLGHRDY
ncbi:NAD-glutamate dehydrogenase, partial [Salmonella enterica subsp. enterica]